VPRRQYNAFPEIPTLVAFRKGGRREGKEEPCAWGALVRSSSLARCYRPLLIIGDDVRFGSEADMKPRRINVR
jgi:hypothetical protein